MLMAAAVGSRHRGAVDTFLLEGEDVSFSLRAVGFWVYLSLLAALAALSAFVGSREDGGPQRDRCLARVQSSQDESTKILNS